MCKSAEAIFHYRLVCFYLYFPLKLHHFCFHVSICQRDLKTEQVPMKSGGQISLGLSNNWSDLGGCSDLGFLSHVRLSAVTSSTSVTFSFIRQILRLVYIPHAVCVLRFNKWLPLRTAFVMAAKTLRSRCFLPNTSQVNEFMRPPARMDSWESEV